MGLPGDTADGAPPTYIRVVQQQLAEVLVDRSHSVWALFDRDGIHTNAGVPAEQVEPGERPTEAAVREVKEECGLEVMAGSELDRRVHPATNRVIIYIACRIARPGDEAAASVADPAELAELRWILRRQVDEYLPDLYGPVQQYLDLSTPGT